VHAPDDKMRGYSQNQYSPKILFGFVTQKSNFIFGNVTNFFDFVFGNMTKGCIFAGNLK